MNKERTFSISLKLKLRTKTLPGLIIYSKTQPQQINKTKKEEERIQKVLVFCHRKY
jgi:hypothetical protein